jgi:hypothetical protein
LKHKRVVSKSVITSHIQSKPFSVLRSPFSVLAVIEPALARFDTAQNYQVWRLFQRGFIQETARESGGGKIYCSGVNVIFQSRSSQFCIRHWPRYSFVEIKLAAVMLDKSSTGSNITFVV